MCYRMSSNRCCALKSIIRSERSDLVVDLMGFISSGRTGKANHGDNRSNLIRQNSEFQDI